MNTEMLAQLFRDTFRGHPAGVTVVSTVSPDGEPVAFTVSSVASFSMEPPRVTLNVITTSKAWPAVKSAERLVVNFLGTEQEAVGKLCAGPFEERFSLDCWETGEDGLPRVIGAKSQLVTKIVDVHEYENNAIVLVEIIDGYVDESQEPLLYHNRNFAKLESKAPELAAS